MTPSQPRLLDYFREVVIVDFEFRTRDDGSVEVRCLCAQELASGRRHRLWLDRQAPCPYPLDDETLLVAHSAGAELGCHDELGWARPANLLDTRVEFVAMTAGARPRDQGTSLSEALRYFKLPYLDQEEKDEMRALAMENKRNSDYTEQEKKELLDYCMSDVDGTVRLLGTLEDHLCR